LLPVHEEIYILPIIMTPHRKWTGLGTANVLDGTKTIRQPVCGIFSMKHMGDRGQYVINVGFGNVRRLLSLDDAKEKMVLSNGPVD
jgi:hypothetical protein